jgi:hypothetical protein
MNKLKKSLWIPLLVVVWIAIPAFGAYVLFGPSPVAHQIRGSGKVHELYAKTDAGTLGSEREQAVLDATRRYVASHPEASADMREGRALAPVEALNADLATRKASFRVRKVDGTRARFYEVS